MVLYKENLYETVIDIDTWQLNFIYTPAFTNSGTLADPGEEGASGACPLTAADLLFLYSQKRYCFSKKIFLFRSRLILSINCIEIWPKHISPCSFPIMRPVNGRPSQVGKDNHK